MKRMKLLTQEILQKLHANRVASHESEGGVDHWPVVKLFMPDGGATWLFTEIDEDHDRLFGLCDLGLGEPELGYASLAEIASVRGRFGLYVERDIHFTAKGPLSEYAEKAREHRQIRT